MWDIFSIFKRPEFRVEHNEAQIYQMPARPLPCTAPTEQSAVRRMRGPVCDVVPMHRNGGKS